MGAYLLDPDHGDLVRGQVRGGLVRCYRTGISVHTPTRCTPAGGRLAHSRYSGTHSLVMRPTGIVGVVDRLDPFWLTLWAKKPAGSNSLTPWAGIWRVTPNFRAKKKFPPILNRLSRAHAPTHAHPTHPQPRSVVQYGASTADSSDESIVTKEDAA